MTSVQGLQIDHVELFVPDRYEAAAWYERVLGLKILREYEGWASDPRGPLMISSDDGVTKLALFEGRPSAPDGGFRRVAFRADAEGFEACLRRLSSLQVPDSRGGPMTDASVIDHANAFSVYFSDPYGHQLEITTYDCDGVRARRPLA
jgi:catechol 2,3-dioxygenase-like lactoylglutathione lyase family enzyme